ncbi:MAG: hypothetical protein D6743_11275 [Calditrichaeota bacterium]|nr:MAG: hypothetical protein D6743_11275 [Calditrichota bacterium]
MNAYLQSCMNVLDALSRQAREGTQIKIASVDSLIKLKQGTVRLQDKLDVKYLQELKNQQKRGNAGT